MNAVLSRLTVLLQDHKEAVLQQWIDRSLADPHLLKCRGLSLDDLRDYVPMLLDELNDSLAASLEEGQPGGASGPEIGGGRAAREHVRHRFAEGYSLAEELRELAHVRAAIVNLCAQHGVVLAGEEAQLVHSTLDEVMITSAVEMEKIASADLREDIALRELIIAILGHDLRNPLAAILFAVASLLKRDDIPEAIGKAHRRISRSAERMRRMVDDLLDTTRVRARGGLPIERKPTDLHAICEQIIEELELTYTDRTLEVELDGDGHGNWDPTRLGQLVSNLLGNALDYSSDKTPVRVVLRDQGATVMVTVHNFGPPIPPEVLPTIFNPFQRGDSSFEVKRRTQGLGLGLFIVREIARAHGGTVEATSDATNGTTFTVTLPRS